jgi:hypothetical protein
MRVELLTGSTRFLGGPVLRTFSRKSAILKVSAVPARDPRGPAEGEEGRLGRGVMVMFAFTEHYTPAFRNHER